MIFRRHRDSFTISFMEYKSKIQNPNTIRTRAGVVCGLVTKTMYVFIPFHSIR